jgi:hypothetical protein
MVTVAFLASCVWGACTPGPTHEVRRATLSPSTGQVAQAASPAFLQIAALAIRGRELQAPVGECCTRCDGAAEPWLSVYENGLLTVRGNALGHLRADGRFVDLDGVDRLLMRPDGHVSMAPGTKNPIAGVEIVVAEDGTTTYRSTANLEELERTTSSTQLSDCRLLGSASANGGPVYDRCFCVEADAVPSKLRRAAAFARVVFDTMRWLSLTGCHFGSTGLCVDYPGDAPASSGFDDN